MIALRRVRPLFFFVTIAAIPGCEVSVFGSDPIVVVGEGTSGGTREAHACEEPEDSRHAREEGDDACDERCVIDAEALAAGTLPPGCERVALGERPGTYVLDLSSHDGVVAELEICDPSGTVLQVSDSPTGAPGGGDAGSSAHDADVLLSGTALHLRASTTAAVPESLVEGWIATTGCSTRSIVLSEQLAWLVDTERGLCGSGMFRISPPVDAEGAPDALFHFATRGSVDGAATGSGLRSVELCFW
jgi:hypothetical protein